MKNDIYTDLFIINPLRIDVERLIEYSICPFSRALIELYLFLGQSWHRSIYGVAANCKSGAEDLAARRYEHSYDSNLQLLHVWKARDLD